MSDREPPTNGPRPAFSHYNFHVAFEGGVEAGFAEISGLDVPGAGDADHALGKRGPGIDRLCAGKPLSVVGLKRGVAGDAFSKWLFEAMAGRVEHRDLRIHLRDEMMRTVVTWTLTNGRPVKIQGPVLNSKGNDVAIEELELQCEGIDCAVH